MSTHPPSTASKKKNWVWRSTPQSRKDQTTSILAIIETVVLVFVTWFAAWYFDSYVHIYSAILLAPLLLLKTPQSIEHAIRWFTYRIDITEAWWKETSVWLVFGFSGIVFFVLFFYISDFSFSDVLGIDLFLRVLKIIFLAAVAAAAAAAVLATGAAVAVAVAVVVVVAVVAVAVAIAAVLAEAEAAAAAAEVAAAAAAFLSTLLLWRSLVIKVVITCWYLICHPIQTITAIPKNYWEQLHVNDVCYSPELLPDIHKQDDQFQLSGLIKYIKGERIRGKRLKGEAGLARYLLILLIPLWALGYLYRWSIKSTAWFYWALAYIVNIEALENQNKQERAGKLVTFKPSFWLSFLISILMLNHYFGAWELSPLPNSSFLVVALTRFVNDYLPLIQWMPLGVFTVGLYWVLWVCHLWNQHCRGKELSTYPFIRKGHYWLARLQIAMWVVFLSYNAFYLFKKYAWQELLLILQDLRSLFS